MSFKNLFLVTALALMAFTHIASADEPLKSGSNHVNVDSCQDVRNGVQLTNFGNDTPYILTNGVRDAGHGLRDYKLHCTSRTQYFVAWTEVDSAENDALKARHEKLKQERLKRIRAKRAQYKQETAEARRERLNKMREARKNRLEKLRRARLQNIKATNPAYDTPTVQAGEPLSLKITDWNKGMPKIEWSQYNGTFYGYKVFVRQGNWSAEDLMKIRGRYVSKKRDTKQLHSLKENTTYSVIVAPFVRHGYKKVLIKDGASNRVLFGTGFKDSVEVNADDPTFNTQNFQITSASKPEGSIVKYKQYDLGPVLSLAYNLPVYAGKMPVMVYTELCTTNLENCTVISGKNNVYGLYPNGGSVTTSFTHDNLYKAMQAIDATSGDTLTIRLKASENGIGASEPVYSLNSYSFIFSKVELP